LKSSHRFSGTTLDGAEPGGWPARGSLRQQRLFRGRKLGRVIVTREEVPVPIHCRYRRMAKPFLHSVEQQLETP
jgi:hypothetical protein